jgi:hypothetical protein
MRMTQPWRTGLPIDFTWNPVPKFFGVIPRFWVHRPKKYQPHPDSQIEKLFFVLAQEALHAGAITAEDAHAAMAAQELRKDFLTINLPLRSSLNLPLLPPFRLRIKFLPLTSGANALIPRLPKLVGLIWRT